MKRKYYYLFRLNMTVLNILSIIIMLFMTVITYRIFNFKFFDIILNNDINLFFVFFLILLYCVIHELIHGLSYVLNGAKFKNVTFGIMLEKGILYCLCKQNISKRNILISSLSPLFFIGVVTYFIGIFCNFPLLVLLSIFNISGSCGDIITSLFICKIKGVEFSELNDPTCFALYSSSELSKVKHFGLKYLEKKDNIKRDDSRKIVCSITSVLILLFLLIISFH